MCSMVKAKSDMETTPQTLTKLLAEQAKDVFCWDVAVIVGMPVLC